MKALATSTSWTKELVQQHARAAVAVEFYTVPFYITAMASIIDHDSDTCKIIQSVIVEEILHLQTAANLCLALDTTPEFKPPQYGSDFPYISPYDPETGDRGFLNGALGPLNDETLNTMLDIETPEQIQIRQAVDHTIPQYPYNSIGEMYDALIFGINQVGVECFSWTRKNQQEHWEKQTFAQIIISYAQARDAIQGIVNQGEGHILNEKMAPPPWTEKNFPIPPYYRLLNEPEDPEPLNGYSHFGRFIQIKNNTLPDIYTGTDQPDHPVNRALQKNFFQLIMMLEVLWSNDGVNVGGSDVLWTVIMGAVQEIFSNTRDCWKAGVVPHWFGLPFVELAGQSK
jgi:rubrerythrin